MDSHVFLSWMTKKIKIKITEIQHIKLLRDKPQPG